MSPTGIGWVNPLNTAGGTIPASTPATGSPTGGWGSSLSFNPQQFMAGLPSYGMPVPSAPGFDTFAPPPTMVPQGAVSNWAAFTQGLLGLGVQFYLQKDAQKRQDELRKNGVQADVVPHPGGGYAVVERASAFSNPLVIAAVVGGGALLLFALLKRK